MRITISTPDGTVAGPVEVPDDMELENFLALSQSEIPSLAVVPIRQLGLYHSGRLINDYRKSLKDCGLVDGDLVMINTVPTSRPAAPSGRAASSGNAFSNIDFSSIQVPGANNRGRPAQQGNAAASAGLPGEMPTPEAFRQMILADPNAMNALRQQNPAIADALNNPEQFARVFTEQISERQAAAMRRFQMLTSNPFDPEVQRLIEQEIQQQEVARNMEHAIEHIPETFGTVTMLYIRCRVNGQEVKAFVDSGAQATIMSEPCARRCNIMRLIDRRFSGIARGVGQSKILGRIHVAQMQIENDFLPTSLTILEDSSVDLLLGLDMLKRHQCIIDLQKNVLVIGTTGTSTPFLPESELPKSEHDLPPMSPGAEDRHLAEALQRSAAEAEAASLSASVAASNALRTVSPAPPSQAGATAQQQPTESTVSQESIDRLVAMGFSREDAVRELTRAGGDVNKAAMALMSSVVASLPAPPSAPKKK